MSIASRIESMTTHLQNDYDALESVVGTITEDKNIENIAPILDNLWEELPHTTGTGTSLSLATKAGKMKVNLLGNTNQTGTPTPSSPIPVNVVSGDNTIVSTGKNLFNKTRYLNAVVGNTSIGQTGTLGSYSNAYATWIQMENNVSYTFSGDLSSVNSNVIRAYVTNDEVQLGISVKRVNNIASGETYTNSDNYKYLVLVFQDVSSYNDNFKWQIELGNTATPYEPYQSNSVLLTLGDKEICKIGNYEDKIFKAIKGNEVYDSLASEEKATLDYGKWYLRKAIGKVVLNGSEDINMRTTGMFGIATNPASVLTANASELIPAYCNRATANTRDTIYNGTNGVAYGSANNYYKNICLRLGNITSIDDFKTYLQNNETIVYYILATPTYTQITGTLKDELESAWRANSYNGTTNISQVNNDLPFNLDITALEG